jgi:hypothetical protein
VSRAEEFEQLRALLFLKQAGSILAVTVIGAVLSRVL